MGFTEAVKSCFSNYANFKGIAVRSEFWYFYLFNFFVAIFAAFIDDVMGSIPFEGPVGIVSAILLLIPNLAVGARRLHDTDRSGWWQLLMVIPIIGAILLIVWWCTKGTPKNTSYDSFGRQIKFAEYDSFGRQVKSVEKPENTSYDSFGRQIKFAEYDSFGRQVKSVEKPEKITTEKNMPKNRDIIDKENFDDVNDEEFYLTATEEVEGGNINAALWTKCMAINMGDEHKSKYDYINMRVEILKKEAQVNYEYDGKKFKSKKEMNSYIDMFEKWK